ncbi:MAG: ABC transporter substrate-binding protein [Rhizobiales bacterium]|nr:ABC transporter substrate-binding protein [Hyphomicrobiales bacterium]
MRRREFITLLAGTAAVWPRAARAQQSTMPVIGFLNSATPNSYARQLSAFRQGLSETGYVEGHNVAVEVRWAENQYDRLPGLAADLVRRQVAVIAANNPAALPAKAATATIPIVFTVGLDPVAMGLVESLNHPGGNATGVTSLNVEMGPKRLDVLREAVPTATTIALLINPANPNAGTMSNELQAAAQTRGLQLHVLHASTERDLDAVFASLVEVRAGALLILTDPLFIGLSDELAALALRHMVPTIFQYREFVAAGGLMSYGGNVSDQFQQVGVYTGRILNGEKPADLPVQQVTKVELIINLKTAKTLGLTIPLTLLGRADEIIE